MNHTKCCPSFEPITLSAMESGVTTACTTSPNVANNSYTKLIEINEKYNTKILLGHVSWLIGFGRVLATLLQTVCSLFVDLTWVRTPNRLNSNTFTITLPSRAKTFKFLLY